MSILARLTAGDHSLFASLKKFLRFGFSFPKLFERDTVPQVPNNGHTRHDKMKSKSVLVASLILAIATLGLGYWLGLHSAGSAAGADKQSDVSSAATAGKEVLPLIEGGKGVAVIVDL